MNGTEKNAVPTKPTNSIGILVLHVFWMLLGPALLFAILYGNTTEDKSWFSGTDVVFFVLLSLVVLARWVDQRSGQCTRSDGQVSTWNDFWRFTYIFVPAALLIWLVTNAIGNYLI